MPDRHKVMIIGLDGASRDTFEQGVDETIDWLPANRKVLPNIVFGGTTRNTTILYPC